MRMIFALLFIICLGCKSENQYSCNYITDYYPLVYRADIEFELENYNRAFELYQKAFSTCNAKNTPTFNEIANFTECSALLKRYDITYKYAKSQIQNGVTLDRFENNKSYAEFLSSGSGQQLISEFPTLRRAFKANANFELRDELIAMQVADQMYRNSKHQKQIAKQDSIDKLHEERLIEIFETIGYPTDRIVGPHTMEYPVNPELLLLHTDDSIRMSYFVPKIKEFVKKGMASPQILGSLIDQYYLYNGSPQIYGTYRTQGGGYADMIGDKNVVDSNRISIGLPPLELKEKKDSLIKLKYGL